MRGDLYAGLVQLAGQFPPSLNTSDDVTALKPFESPACYGVDMTSDGQLRTGTIPTGTARVATTKTAGSTFLWHYDRMWRFSGSQLIYGAKYYDKRYLVQGKGQIAAEAAIVGFQPALRDNMWVYGASGSQFIDGATRENGQFSFKHLIQEMTVSTGKGTSAVTLDEIPYCANTKGVWSFDGTAVKELTRPVRNSLGAFATEPAITCDYQKKYLIGTAQFAIDVNNGKLFDYSQAAGSFLFTSRTLVTKSYRPYGLGNLFFSIQGNPADLSAGVISWQSKVEDADWQDETDISVTFSDGVSTVIQVPMENPCTTTRRFSMRITALSANIYIRSIEINVSDYDQGSFSA